MLLQRLCFLMAAWAIVDAFSVSIDLSDKENEGFMASSADCLCPPGTAKVMLSYRQCLLRKDRQSLSEEDYTQKLNAITSDCNIGDVCLSYSQAVWRNTTCVQEESGTLMDLPLRDIYEPSIKWHQSVTYSLSNIYSAEEVKQIQAAFKEFTAKTCLTFTQVTFNTNENLQVVSGSGCSSYIGKVSNSHQAVTLKAQSFCMMPGSIRHEIGHALGLIHEHSRPDRDSFITVNWDDIAAGINKDNFAKSFNVDTTGKYDYNSMMHYARSSGAKTGTNTLVPTDSKHLSTIGQRAGFSFYDLLSINNRYCKDICPSPSITCLRGGYLNPNDCQQCLCQPFFGGPRCEDLKPHSNVAVCQGAQLITLAVGSSHTLSISDYNNADLACLWKVQTTPGYFIVVNKTPKSKYLIGASTICKAHWLEFRDKTAENVLGTRLCGITYPVALTSQSHALLVMFSVTRYTDFSLPTYNGFSLTITTVKDRKKCAVPTGKEENAENDIGSKLVWDMGNVIVYTCNDGFYVKEGQNTFTRTCLDISGVATWSTEQTICTNVTCALRPVVPNTNGGSPSGSSFNYGQEITYTCADGYSTSGGKSFTSNCTESATHQGTWNNLHTCHSVPTVCASAPMVNNSDGGMPVNTSYPVGDSVTFKCDTGYFVNGETNDTFVATCTLQGVTATWTGVATCSSILCGNLLPNLVENAKLVNVTTEEEFDIGTAALYRCSGGFSLKTGVSDVMATCSMNNNSLGVWIPEAHCQDIDECGTATSPCADNSPCKNTVGSYMCPCNDTQDSDRSLRFSAVFAEAYSELYGNLSNTEQREFRESAETELTKVYNDGGNNSTEAVYVCKVRSGSTIVEHIAQTRTNLTDAEKGIYAKAARDSLKAAGNLSIAGNQVTLSQALGLTTQDGIYEITSACSFLEATGTCQNNGNCTVGETGIPECSSSDTSGEFTAFYIIGAVVAGFVLLAILFAICFLLFKNATLNLPQKQGNAQNPQHAFGQPPPTGHTRRQLVPAVSPYAPLHAGNQQVVVAGTPQYYVTREGTNAGIGPQSLSNAVPVSYPSPQRFGASAYNGNYYRGAETMATSNPNLYQ